MKLKKIGIIISAVILMLGLAQCRKPDLSGWNHINGDTETIEFTTNFGGGEKGCFNVVASKLAYAWDLDDSDGNNKIDSLQIYAQSGGTEFVSGSYLGSIPIVSADGYTAKFRGRISLPAEDGRLRLIHFGQGIKVSSNGSAVADLSTQDGEISSISNKIVAVWDVEYKKGNISFTANEVDIQFSLMNLDLSNYATCDISMVGEAYNRVSVDKYGVITRDMVGSDIKLEGVTDLSKRYYIAIITGKKTIEEVTSSTKLSFETDALEGGGRKKLIDNKYYCYEDPDGNGVPVAVRPIGSLYGVFTVNSANDQIRLSKGNLWYLGKEEEGKKWRFADEQYYVLGNGYGTGTNNGNYQLDSKYNGLYNCFSNEATPTQNDKDAARDLLGWGCSGWDNGNSRYQPYNTINYQNHTEGNAAIANFGFGYGPRNGNYCRYSLTETYANADWGVYCAITNGGNQAGKWRLLTSDELKYVLGSPFLTSGGRTQTNRFAKAKVKGKNGVLIFPDHYNDGTTISGYTGIAQVNNKDAAFPSESMDNDVWEQMENEGVAFFPTAGFRDQEKIKYVSDDFFYWTSTVGSQNYFAVGYSPNLIGDRYKCRGFSVRLVCDVVPSGIGSAVPFGSGNW